MNAEPHAAAGVIRACAGGAAPRFGLILGSGSGGLAALVEEAVTIDYGELPGFPVPSVEGHAGRLLLGQLGGVAVACLQGRAHAYEGAGIQAMLGPCAHAQADRLRGAGAHQRGRKFAARSRPRGSDVD